MIWIWCLWIILSLRLARASLELQCIQTIHDVSDVYNKPLVTKRVQNYRPKDPSRQDLHIYLDPCEELADSKLAFHFDIKSSQATGNFGSHVILCLKTALNLHLKEELTCFNFTILSSESGSEISCWTKLVSYKETLLMKTYAAVHDLRQAYHLYSELHTLGLDSLCSKDLSKELIIRKVHGCNASGFFRVKTNYEVKSIEATDGNSIKTSLPFNVKDNGKAEFKLHAEMKGRYKLKIDLYDTDLHMYFAFTRQIDVICDLATIPLPLGPHETDNSISFPAFIVVVALALLILIAAIVAFAVNITRIRRVVCRRQAVQTVRRPSEMVSLNSVEGQSGLNSQNGRARLPFQPMSTIPSRSSSAHSASTPMDEKETRSETSALQEYKQIMVLPLPYDPYVRDLIGCLKDVLSFQGNITFKCLYDHQELEAYVKNKSLWMNSVLSNSNTVVLVLCFTSLNFENRERTPVDEILDQCKPPGAKSMAQVHRVYFVNMTGQDYGPHNYHSEAVVIRGKSDVIELVGKVFAACGCNTDRDAMQLKEAVNSESFGKLMDKLQYHE